MKCDGPEPFVVGPTGERLTRADLPGPDIRRWVPRRKAQVVAAVEGGLISRQAALERYSLSAEEYDSWKATLSRFGVRGLRVTRLSRMRGAVAPQDVPRDGDVASGAQASGGIAISASPQGPE